jgi:2-polyprenyl-3-methyl-5-hydroxy-6-metoxy-1,4-benzoquinol methylase
MNAARRTKIPCPVCRSVDQQPFASRGGYEIVRCRACGHRYLNPPPTAEEVAALYDESYFKSDGSLDRGYGDYAAQAHNIRRTFQDRLRYLPETRGQLLDVGAAAGFFVEQARLAGWDAEGVEPSAWASRYARERLGQPVRTCSLDEAAFPDASFDVVTCWEVIEHLPDPRRLLAEMARVLKPGGHLLMSTPDAGSTVARVSGQRWLGWYKVPEHLQFFDEAGLARLCTEVGLRVERTRYVSLTVSLEFAMQRLGALVGVPLLGKVPGFARELPVRVNPLYDLMLVARRT